MEPEELTPIDALEGLGTAKLSAVALQQAASITAIKYGVVVALAARSGPQAIKRLMDSHPSELKQARAYIQNFQAIGWNSSPWQKIRNLFPTFWKIVACIPADRFLDCSSTRISQIGGFDHQVT